MWFLIFEIFVLSFLAIYGYFKYKFRFWKVRNVPYAEPEIPFGNYREHILQKLSIREMNSKILKKHVKDFQKTPYFGVYIFTRPILCILTPDLIKAIWVEAFEYFPKRILYYHAKNDPLSANILFLYGEEWKFVRTKMSPTFTSSKIKVMIHTMIKSAKNMEQELKKFENGQPFEIREVMIRYLLDIIAECAYGFELNSYKDRQNEFYKQANRAKNRSLGDVIRGFVSVVSPTLMTLLKLRILPHEPADFFLEVIKKTIADREKNNITRNDLLNMMIQLKNIGYLDDEKDDNKGKLSVTQIAAHSFMFFLAGFETSSVTLTSFIYEVSKHPEVQEKCRKEIVEVLNQYKGEICYEYLKDLTYTTQVLNETLRLHPISEFLGRECMKRYKLPDSDLVLEKGQFVFIPVTDIHRNPKYFANPDTFDPDRFSSQRKQEINPYTFLPFGHGPRFCIGNRFAFIQMKVAIVTMLMNYRFTVNPRTKEPLKQVPSTFLNDYDGGIWVDIEKIN